MEERDEFERLSIIRTLNPRSIMQAEIWLPIKPRPPVSKIVLLNLTLQSYGKY